METKIELMPGTRVTIETNENGSTISIYEKETPSYKFKDGDFIYSTQKFDIGEPVEWLYVFSHIDENRIILCHRIYSIEEKRIVSSCFLGKICEMVDSRLMTNDEKNLMISKLKDNSERWDAENKKIVSIQTEFKVGDVVKYETKNGWSNQYLIKGLALAIGASCSKDELYSPICGLLSFRSGSLNLKLEDSIGTNSFFKLMEEKGVKFNPESGEVEKIRWEPRHDEIYYYVGAAGWIYETFLRYEGDAERVLIGNFFKTEAQAEAAAERVKKLFAEIQAEIYK